MSILVSGSIANDYIMNFHDQFGKYILPDHTDKLSVNFNINELQSHSWWAWHNIAYNLGLLWEKALLLGAVWKEFVATDWQKKHIDYRYTYVSETLGTPSAHIITDEHNNQITAFYPWASAESGQQSVHDVTEEVAIGIVWPNNPLTMLQHLKECKERWIPVIFDPGQPLSAFNKEQLHTALTNATYLIVNEYELALLCKLAELEEKQLLNYVESYIVTLWAEWSCFTSKDDSFTVDALLVEHVVDPTGAGDSFRAWVLWSLKHNKWRKYGMELWSKLASECIQFHGTQHHKYAE